MRTPKIGEPVQYTDEQSKVHAALILRLRPSPSPLMVDLRVFSHGAPDADADAVKHTAGLTPAVTRTWRWLEEA